MGLTAESVHIQVGEGFPGAIRNRAVESVREHLRQEGFVEVDDEAASDRVVTLGPVEGHRWISVLDSQPGSLEKLARAVSRDLAATAVGTMVFDSDDIFVVLMKNGKPVDRYERAEGRTRRADPELWPCEGKSEAFREALEARPLFAEEQLARLAEALGIDSTICLTPASEANGEGFIHLCFRHRSTAGQPRAASGPPEFRSPGVAYPPFELGVGEKLWQSMTGYVTNKGGTGTGVRVTAGGTALGDELIRVDAIHVLQPGNPRVTEIRLEGSLSAEVPELRIGAGITQPEAGNAFQLINQMRKRAKQPSDFASTVSAYVSGEVIAPGEGTLTLTFEPLDNPGRGAASQQFSLIVRPPARTPLKASANMPGMQMFMRCLDDPRHVVAVASLAQVPGVRAAAIEAIEIWARFLQPLRAERWHMLQSGTGLLSLPKQYLSRSSDLLSDRHWKTVRSRFEECSGCSGHLGEEVRDGKELWEGCAGWDFDPSTLQATMLQTDFSPQLAFGLDTQVFDSAVVNEAGNVIASIFDRLLDRGLLHQAFQARWRCGSSSAAPATIYEMACGVQGQCTTTEAWCKRYLRGVGSRVWLGPDLCKHLDETATGLRLDWTGSLDQLETKLAPVLAGREEWEQGLRAMYQGQLR